MHKQTTFEADSLLAGRSIADLLGRSGGLEPARSPRESPREGQLDIGFIAYNRQPMDLERLLHFVFVLYCATTGVVFLLLPWSPGYDHLLAFFYLPAVELLRLPLVRGAISGFGIVHLVWGLHDMAVLLRPPMSHGDDRP